MNPRRSPTTTGSLPIDSAKRRAACTTLSSVTKVRTSSMSFMTGAGLKKWNPMTRLGRRVCTAMSITGSDDVLVAMMQSSLAAASTFANVACLSSSFSGTASTMSWRSARAPKSVLPVMRAAASSRWSWLSLSRRTARSSEPSMRSRPASTAASLSSTKTTSSPRVAHSSAMPAPIVPQPTTPMRSILSATAAVAASAGRAVAVMVGLFERRGQPRA